MTLMDGVVGQKLNIVKIHEGSARRRLLDFGFTAGAEIMIHHIAPFGGTVLVGIRGYTLVLREQAGELIEVEPVATHRADKPSDDRISSVEADR